MEKLRADCQLCTDPISDRPILKEGVLNYRGKRIRWVVIPSEPSSVKGRQIVFTTVSHHVGSEEVEVRERLLVIGYRTARELLGGSFRTLFNQGPLASSFEHFHCHFIAPGEGERLVSGVVNIPQVLADAATNGLISSEAAHQITEKVLQRPR